MNSTAITRRAQLLTVSTFTFFLFQCYQVDFLLHITARIPGVGVLRPTMLMFLIITIMLFAQKEKLTQRLNHPILKAYGLFILIAFLSLPLVKYPGSVIKANLPVFIKAIVFLYFTALILDTEKRFKWAMVTFVICQVLRVLEPLYLNITDGYWGSQTWMDGEFANRLSGAPHDVINPNELGFVIATVIPFLHYYLMPGRWFVKIFYFGLLAVLLYALILTMSRGAFLALVVVGWVVFKDSKNKFMLVIAGVIMVFAALAVMNDAQRDRYLSLFSSESKQSKSAEGRVNGAIHEFGVGLTRPIFGHGLGTTPEAKANNGYGPQASHNMYAEILIEVGFVGMFFFFKFIRQIYLQIKDLTQRIEQMHPFHAATARAAKVIFWMFILYSSNYWGLNQYYWYHFAGLMVALACLSGASDTEKGKVP